MYHRYSLPSRIWPDGFLFPILFSRVRTIRKNLTKFQLKSMTKSITKSVGGEISTKIYDKIPPNMNHFTKHRMILDKKQTHTTLMKKIAKVMELD